MEKMWQVIAWGAKELEQSGIVNAEFESSLLMRWLLNMDQKQLIFKKQVELSEQETAQFHSIIQQRKTGYPLQYITSRQEFMGLEFMVTPDVLIPRWDTEVLIESILKKALPENITAVDVGTGSGAIAISLASFQKGWNIYATDISEKALKIAGENAKNLGVEVIFLWGNLLEPIKSLPIKVHLIVSNPPYIPTEDIKSLMREVQHEPINALDGGIAGLDYYSQLIPESFELLENKGLIALEIGIGQSSQIFEMCLNQGFSDIRLIEDYQGHPRVVLAQKNIHKGMIK